MIQSFSCKQTEELFNSGKAPAGPLINIEASAYRKLRLLNSAAHLSDLQLPSGNRLHALAGDRKGQHSITVAGGFRICFVWKENGPHDVEIVNYH